jgi:hypothetical protein
MVREIGLRRPGRRSHGKGASLWALGLALALGAAAAAAQVSDARLAKSRHDPPRLPHPAITLKDAAGKNVLESGGPISPRKTCGGDCHDVDFIADSFHSTGQE